MYNILVTGANGQLGSEIKTMSSTFGHRFYFMDVQELDITNEKAIHEVMSVNKIHLIINCAAYTAVDKAESEAELADLINHQAVKYLANAAKAHGAKLIHVSTDYVFDGEAFQPYRPDAACHPQSVYGHTKREGEGVVSASGLDGSMIIRTAWVYSSFGSNFVKTISRLAKEREQLNVVGDQIGSPTYARDLALFILNAVDQLNWEGVKIFHYTNEGICSWYDFAKMIVEMQGLSCQVNSIPAAQYPTPAKRPYYSVLSKEETKHHFNISIPHWTDALRNCLNILKS